MENSALAASVQLLIGCDVFTVPSIILRYLCSVDRSHSQTHLFALLLGRTVDNGQVAGDEVVLDVDYEEGGHWTDDLKGKGGLSKAAP